MEGKFNLESQTKPGNKVLKIQYQPNPSVKECTYEIYKDGKLYDTFTKKNNKISVITLNETGTFKIKVTTLDKENNQKVDTSGLYKIDLDKPVIVVYENMLKMEKLSKKETLKKEDLEDVIKVKDKQDGNLFDKMNCDFSGVNFYKEGLYNLKCSVTDEASNKTEQVIPFQITASTSKQLVYAQGLIILALLVTILLLLRYRKAIYYERKIEEFSLKPIHVKKAGLLDYFEKKFHHFIEKISKVLKKSIILEKHSQKFTKYNTLLNFEKDDAINFISLKLVTAFALVLITFFSKTIQFKILKLYDLLIPFLFGYFLPNVVYKIKYKIYFSKLENDLLQAIIIMNNAFKSGRSITQAMELVTKELTGPICEEFKKMVLEMSFGLSVEVVFKRFSERVNLEEVTYLTASLAILNKTGGNIIKVFSAIEKSLFNRKKLKLELKSLTSASKMIVVILFLVPFFFIAFITIISPTYFMPFFKSPIGIFFVFVMLAIYLLYIWFVQKIMKVRM